ncbi:hypothetical protein F4604DRAFT_1717309 [Suillus subluteus]|nr:hypothetical protein F4604DRAFT_1717309 [Suillus subluteus]
MRFSFVLATVVVLTAAIFANGDDSEICPFFCRHSSECKTCDYAKWCVSISNLCPGTIHRTHQHGRSSLYATVGDKVVG